MSGVLTMEYDCAILSKAKGEIRMKEDIIEEIQQLKKKHDAIILAHYYVNQEVQEIADYVGDSYYLSKIAVSSDKQTIVFAGVKFMAESAKLLNPNKTVLMPDQDADCFMAHMVNETFINQIKDQYEDLCVVCYINSTAKIKSLVDVCVTSSNAKKIIAAIPNKNILFIPDQNLGKHIADYFPEKNFIFCDGYCPIHHALTKKELLQAKTKHPNAPVLIHPECKKELLELSDYVGSTAGIIEYAKKDDHEEFIIVTEIGVFYELQKQNPNKKFYPINDRQICNDMKKITLLNIRDCLKERKNEVVLEKTIIQKAQKPLQKMHELAK